MEKACTYKTGVGTDFFAQDVRIAETVRYINDTYHMQINGRYNSQTNQFTITVTVNGKERELTPFLGTPEACKSVASIDKAAGGPMREGAEAVLVGGVACHRAVAPGATLPSLPCTIGGAFEFELPTKEDGG